MAYPDWWDERLGDGFICHHDHGAVYYSRYGVDYSFCVECNELVPDDDLDGLDRCPECVERERENRESEEEE